MSKSVILALVGLVGLVPWFFRWNLFPERFVKLQAMNLVEFAWLLISAAIFFAGIIGMCWEGDKKREG